MVCKTDQIINPKTGRCVKKNGKIGKEILAKTRTQRRKSRSPIRRMVCKADQIINTKTGRCVKKNGKIGKEILAKTRTQRRKSRSPIRRRKSRSPIRRRKSRSPIRRMVCKADQIINTKTGRCVKKNGKIGKEILAKTRTQSRTRRKILRSPKLLVEKRSRIIQPQFDYIEIKKGSTLYRGTQNPGKLDMGPYWFTRDYGTAYQFADGRGSAGYLVNEEEGYIDTYKLTKSIRLIRLDNHKNLKLLLNLIRDDDVLKGYKMMVPILLNNKPFLISKSISDADFKKATIMRSSTNPGDYHFSKWLCDQGYHGFYSPPGMIGYGLSGLTDGKMVEEMVICKSPDIVKLEGSEKVDIVYDSDDLYILVQKYMKKHPGTAVAKIKHEFRGALSYLDYTTDSEIKEYFMDDMDDS